MITRKRILQLGVGVLAIAAGVAAAQGMRGRMAGPGAFGPGWNGQRLGFIAGHLNLTDSQKEQAQSVFKAARESAKPIADQLRQNHDAMKTAVQQNDSAKIEQVASAQGQLVGQVAAIYGKAFAQFYTTLTPDQKAKADQLHDRAQARFHSFRQRHQRPQQQ
jgi:Spy/CpxP family protein refolding chaperone